MSTVRKPKRVRSTGGIQPIAVRQSGSRAIRISPIAAAGTKLIRRRSELLTDEITKQLDKLDSQFRQDIETIYETLDSAHPDIVQLTYLTAALTAVVRMIPNIEHKAMRTRMPADVSAFNSLLEQGSKLSDRMQKADARIKSSDNMAKLLENIVDSHYQAVGYQLVTGLSMLRNDLQPTVDDDNLLRMRFHTLAEDIGGYLETSKQSLKDAIDATIRSNTPNVKGPRGSA